jgi:hypothetical protein
LVLAALLKQGSKPIHRPELIHGLARRASIVFPSCVSAEAAGEVVAAVGLLAVAVVVVAEI